MVWEYHDEWQPNCIIRCGEGEYLVAGNHGNDAVLVKLLESKTPVGEADPIIFIPAILALLFYSHYRYGTAREVRP